MCGCFTSQKFLGSMEGATLAGKLAAEVVANRALGNPDQEVKAIQQHVVDAARDYEARKPIGIVGDGPIAFGAGYSIDKKEEARLRETDPAQYDAAKEELAVAA